MGQSGSKRKPSDVEERLIDPTENTDIEGAHANSIKVLEDSPDGKEHSSFSRLLKLGNDHCLLLIVFKSLLFQKLFCFLHDSSTGVLYVGIGNNCSHCQ